MFSPLEQFDVVLVTPLTLNLGFIVLETSIFHGSLILLFIVIFFYILTYLVGTTATLVPKGYQIVIEQGYSLVLGLLKGQTGERGYMYLPFVMSIFVFILLANLFSLLPFSFALTSHIINIVFLTITLISGLFLLGCINFGFHFMKLFIPESPFILLFLLIPIEIFSYIIRAFSMALRLSANIMAGHTLVFIVSGFLLKLSTVFMLVTSLILLAIFFLEFGVALLQAYVFTVLFCIYLRESLYEPQH